MDVPSNGGEITTAWLTWALRAPGRTAWRRTRQLCRGSRAVHHRGPSVPARGIAASCRYSLPSMERSGTESPRVMSGPVDLRCTVTIGATVTAVG
jgi:hypothetical protein